MRKQRLTALRIEISRRRIALHGICGRLRPRTDILAELPIDTDNGNGFDEIENRLDDALRDAQVIRLPAKVVIADDLARFFMVTPPRNVAGLQDCKAAASMRFNALYGEAIDAWRVVGDWNVDKPFLACALPRKLVDAIIRVATTHRVTLVEVAPQFVAAWNTWASVLKPDAWFGVLLDSMLTLGATAQGHLVSVRTAALATHELHGLVWLGQHVAREALRLSIDAPTRIQLCGKTDERWTTSTSGPLVCEWLGAVLGGSGPDAHTSATALASAGDRE